MKGVPIKFRGRFWLKGLDPSDINTRLSDGDFVFGGYARMKFLFDDDDGDYIIQNDSTAFLVYPNSVSQLVGYDANGEEVYTGDRLLSLDNDTLTAACFSNADYKYYRIMKGKEPADFYADLSAAVMQSYHAARTGKIIDYLHKEGCGSCAADLDVSYCDEEGWLGDIMVMCIKRLEQLGYDESARQEIYQAVNNKNRARGYFEE